MRAYKPSFIALLAVNLSPDSRIKRKLSGFEASRAEILLSLIVDNLVAIKCGIGGGTPPDPLTPVLLGQKQETEKQVTCYNTPEEWHEAMRKYEV